MRAHGDPPPEIPEEYFPNVELSSTGTVMHLWALLGRGFQADTGWPLVKDAVVVACTEKSVGLDDILDRLHDLRRVFRLWYPT